VLATARALRPHLLRLEPPAATVLLRGSHTARGPSWQLPAFPPAWRPVAGSRVVTPIQRYAVFATGDGTLISLHSTLGSDFDRLPARLARVSLGGHRISVHPNVTGDGFVAAWEAGGVAHHLTARPSTLAAFMELLMSVGWAA
jgi:hypothetical protein